MREINGWLDDRRHDDFDGGGALSGHTERFAILSQAAESVASPQIRNQGTIGGNVSQDARCWYYRNGWTCYRAGGNICYADTPAGMNREHAIFDADRCVGGQSVGYRPALVAMRPGWSSATRGDS